VLFREMFNVICSLSVCSYKKLTSKKGADLLAGRNDTG
jgi:hypothetical protein